MTRGGLWSLGGQVATFGAALVATPFTIRLLGPALYGLWSILQTILSWVVPADLGMAQASTRFGGERKAQGDVDGEVKVVWTAALITVSVTTCAVAVLAFAAPLVLSDLLQVRGRLLGPGITALRIICAVCVAQTVSGTLNTPQVVRLRWRSYTLVTSGTAILQVAAIPVALAAISGGVVTAAIVALGAAVLGALGTFGVAARIQPAILRPRTDRQIGKVLVRYGGALTASGVAAIPLMSAERFLLAHYTSTVIVAYYAVAWRLATLLSAIAAAIAAPLFPALVALEGAGRISSARAIYRQALQGAFVVLTPAVIALVFNASPFLALWAGRTYAHHSLIPFYILVVGVWCNSLAWIPFSHLLASNRTALIAKVHLLELLPYIIVGAVLTSSFGAVGAAMVSSGRTIVDSVVFFWAARRTADLPSSPLSSHVLASIGAPIALAVAFSLMALITTDLATRLAVTLPTLIVYGGLVWALVLSSTERAGLGALMREVVPGAAGQHRA